MFNEAITEEQVHIPAFAASGISVAAKPDRSSTIAVVTIAFATDPIARWIYADAADYLSYFPGFIRSFAGGAFDAGTAFISDGMAGAALWLPPGFSPDDETLTARFEATVDSGLLPELEDMFEQMATFHPTEPHWYLPMIGVETHRQGSGVGSRLLEYSLARVDAERLPAYLESSSPRNIPLYERFGFSVIGTIKTASSPPMYPMIRRARKQ
jgi:ribosomal protein S18 acetylase RimI-like enzyme